MARLLGSVPGTVLDPAQGSSELKSLLKMQTLRPYSTILKSNSRWGPLACIFLETLLLHLWVSTLAKSDRVSAGTELTRLGHW